MLLTCNDASHLSWRTSGTIDHLGSPTTQRRVSQYLEVFGVCLSTEVRVQLDAWTPSVLLESYRSVWSLGPIRREGDGSWCQGMHISCLRGGQEAPRGFAFFDAQICPQDDTA